MNHLKTFADDSILKISKDKLKVNKDSFAEYTIEDIEKTLQSLLLDLVKYKTTCSSATRIIPLFQGNDLLVSIGLHTNLKEARETFEACDYTGAYTFCSRKDIIQAVEEVCEKNQLSGPYNHILFIEFLLKLGIDPSDVNFKG